MNGKRKMNENRWTVAKFNSVSLMKLLCEVFNVYWSLTELSWSYPDSLNGALKYKNSLPWLICPVLNLMFMVYSFRITPKISFSSVHFYDTYCLTFRNLHEGMANTRWYLMALENKNCCGN